MENISPLRGLVDFTLKVALFFTIGTLTYQDRINASTVAFFHGTSRVHLDTILNAGEIR